MLLRDFALALALVLSLLLFSPIPTYQLISANAKVVSCTLLLLLHVVAAAAAAAVVVVVALAGNVVKMLIF